MLFYEAPHKLAATLRDLLAALGDRELVLVRELTKLHEEAERTTLSAAAARYAEAPPKGELVLVIRGAEPQSRQAETSPQEAVQLARAYAAQGMPAAQAAKRAAQECGLRKTEVYRLLVSEPEL